ncbi:MAG TPA: MarR family transcriptional regulator [Gemmatimonas sp.]|nr:MarR family transcriptional regulator [Gemmatimonas sp.]
MRTSTSLQLTLAEGMAWGGLLRSHARLTRVLDAEMRAAHDTPLTWFDALFQLGRTPDAALRLTELGDRLLLTPSGCSRLVDRLEIESLVRRQSHPGDGRAIVVKLTARGRRRLMQLHSTHVAGIRRHFLARLSSDDLETLRGVWAKLLVD